MLWIPHTLGSPSTAITTHDGLFSVRIRITIPGYLIHQRAASDNGLLNISLIANLMEVVPKIPVLTDYEMDQWSGSWDRRGSVALA
jgi:hypothetical protein